jgi:Flp pilus assembly protein TadB
MAGYRPRFRKRFKKFKKTYRKKRKQSGMKVKHKQWLTGAVGITVFFIAMPHIFSNILARVRGGA